MHYSHLQVLFGSLPPIESNAQALETSCFRGLRVLRVLRCRAGRSPWRGDHIARANVRLHSTADHTMSKKDQQPDDVADDAHGVTESQQDRKHDDAAKQRPGQEDLKVHDEQSRRPTGKAGQGE
ncbi:conserved hypothetical protein [Xanthomonas euvesicatoria pv. vesicatoria str. 85-10]|uniref:Uncharacterized protein n=3 Tax=Xanthomonas TaxID=338 RepID=Q3BSB0_XANE5|nr:conserved hypothetical protein [Xanthomonas euvesicatoria pv. vesicatoria str. 85-10]